MKTKLLTVILAFVGLHSVIGQTTNRELIELYGTAGINSKIMTNLGVGVSYFIFEDTYVGTEGNFGKEIKVVGERIESNKTIDFLVGKQVFNNAFRFTVSTGVSYGHYAKRIKLDPATNPYLPNGPYTDDTNLHKFIGLPFNAGFQAGMGNFAGGAEVKVNINKAGSYVGIGLKLSVGELK